MSAGLNSISGDPHEETGDLVATADRSQRRPGLAAAISPQRRVRSEQFQQRGHIAVGGRPQEHRGRVAPLLRVGLETRPPGLYVLGLRFQYYRNSNFIDGVGRDARYIANHIEHRRARAGYPKEVAA